MYLRRMGVGIVLGVVGCQAEVSSPAEGDECAQGTDNCDVHATCTSTGTGFSCTCNPPYVGDGVTCALPCALAPPTGPLPRVHSVPIKCAATNVYSDYLSGDVALAEDSVVVGMPAWLSAPPDHSSALVFEFDGTTWQFVQELLPAAPNLPAGHYGDRVEVSRTGQTIVVSDRASAFVFRRSGDRWVGGEELLPVFDAGACDILASVSTTDTHTALAFYGAASCGNGGVYLFDPVTQVEEQRILDVRFNATAAGNSVSIDNDLMVVANRGATTVVYRLAGASWGEEQALANGADAATDGVTIAVPDAAATERVHLFTFDTLVWAETGTVICNAQCDVSIFADRLALGGAPAYAETGYGGLFHFTGASWLVEHEPTFESLAVDAGRSFAATMAEGFEADPLRVVQFADFP